MSVPLLNLRQRVDHVVIIIKENHTYDNYLGTFPHSEGDIGSGRRVRRTIRYQFMYSNAAHGPEGPIAQVKPPINSLQRSVGSA
jgi:Phosphoesterase family